MKCTTAAQAYECRMAWFTEEKANGPYNIAVDPEHCTANPPTAGPTMPPTAAPTNGPPTIEPTLIPTWQRCNFGQQGCDSSEGSICIDATPDDEDGWLCACGPGYRDAFPTAYPSEHPTSDPLGSQKEGEEASDPLDSEASAPLDASSPQTPRLCVKLTGIPTTSPTTTPPPTSPTESPVGSPSPSPVPLPTTSPTRLQCTYGTHGCASESPGGACFHADMSDACRIAVVPGLSSPHSADNVEQNCAEQTEYHTVQCCSDTQIAGFEKRSDKCPWTYQANTLWEVDKCRQEQFVPAQQLCDSLGARLCTAIEVSEVFMDCKVGLQPESFGVIRGTSYDVTGMNPMFGTLQQCSEACDRSPDCVGFSHDLGTSSENDLTCFMKSGGLYTEMMELPGWSTYISSCKGHEKSCLAECYRDGLSLPAWTSDVNPGPQWSCGCADGYRVDPLYEADYVSPQQPRKCVEILHPCEVGTHACDTGPGGICYQNQVGDVAWRCGCDIEYTCTAGCGSPHVGHTCELRCVKARDRV